MVGMRVVEGGRLCAEMKGMSEYIKKKDDLILKELHKESMNEEQTKADYQK